MESVFKRWDEDTVLIFSGALSRFSDKLNVTGVPNGWQNITVYVEYIGEYYYYYNNGKICNMAKFYIDGSLTVSFFMDAAPPKIIMLSPLNQTYTIQDVPLSFYVNETTSTLAYSLDGAGPTAILGNTTMAGLTLGTHNVTVYARDRLGRKGASETIVFTVSDPS